MFVYIYLLSSFFVDTHALPVKRAIPPVPVTACATVTKGDVERAGTQLHVIRGERDAVMISILGFGEAPQVSAAAERLARKALGALLAHDQPK